LLSIPRTVNPSLDDDGRHSSINQYDKNVWFLTGTFGNLINIRRRCIIPEGKAILFPILEKEDSFTEDSDLKTEADLIKRSKEATDKVVHLEAVVDGERISNLEDYRVRSEVFDLTFPNDNVYGVTPGITRSVCDGYWLFMKPLEEGKHIIYFKGENLLSEPYTAAMMKQTAVYNRIHKYIIEESKFKIEVTYELIVIRQKRGNQIIGRHIP
jgi:hypothetical protein